MLDRRGAHGYSGTTTLAIIPYFRGKSIQYCFSTTPSPPLAVRMVLPVERYNGNTLGNNAGGPLASHTSHTSHQAKKCPVKPMKPLNPMAATFPVMGECDSIKPYEQAKAIRGKTVPGV